jgi:AcrR family transcriptional regulator
MIGLQQRVGPVDNGRFVRMEAELLHRLCGVRTYVEWADFGLALRISPWSTRALRKRGAGTSAVADPLWSKEADERSSPKTGRPRRRRRLRAQDFFAAARRLLADHGCDAITVVGLCNALEVTKGSFSHHFAGMDDFVTRMAAAWSEQRQQWLDQCADTPAPPRRLAALYLPLLERPEAAESAWHAWGWTNRTVGQALAQVEAQWQELLTTTLTELEHDPATASLLAEMTVALAVGLGQRQQPLEASDTAIVVLLWLTTALGVEAELVDDQIRLVVRLRPVDSAEASSRRAPSARNRI